MKPEMQPGGSSFLLWYVKVGAILYIVSEYEFDRLRSKGCQPEGAERMKERFVAAWRAVTRVPISGEASQESLAVLPYFPLIGLLVGLCLWGAAALLGWIATPVVAGFLGALLIPALGWGLDGGRMLVGVMTVVDRWEQGAASPSGRTLRPYGALIFLQGAFLTKAVTVGLLIHAGAAVWLVASVVIGTAALAESAVGQPKVARWSPGARFANWWLVAGAVALVAGGMAGFAVGGLVAGIVAWLAVPTVAAAMQERIGAGGAETSWCLREVAETVTLVAGVLLLVSN